MAKTKLLWNLRGSDFQKPGWHTKPTVGYELMFEFLRLSPSYELARKANMEGLATEDKAKLPQDFKSVLETYKQLGNVQQILFRQWWIKRGIKIFGNPFNKPKVHCISHIKNGEEANTQVLSNQLNEYLNDVRRDDGMVGALIVAIPLGVRKSEVKKQVEILIDEHMKINSGNIQQPIIKFEGQRLRTKVLFNGLRLLWFKSAKPNIEDWRLGSMAKLSKTYSSVLDPKSPRKVKDSIEAVDREMMTKITYRALKKFEAVAENAARGKFPSEAPVEITEFDYKILAKRIQRKNTWERIEKDRLLKQYQAAKNHI